MKAIVAMDLNGVIGIENRIPWHIPEDFKHFKKVTMGGNLLMGNKTYTSIGKPLPGRTTYVLTRNMDLLTSTPKEENLKYVDENFIKTSPNSFLEKTWLCGGSKVYEQFLPFCDEMYVTIVLDEYEGDTFMPEFETLFPNSEIYKETRKYWIVRYVR